MKKLPVVVGGGVGAFIGSSVGIAALGTAFAGTLPLALLGAAAGWLWSRHKEQQDAPTANSSAINRTTTPPAKPVSGERIRKVCMTDRAWIADRDQDCKENAYDCALQIRTQFVQARASMSEMLKSNDLWARGYIFGFADGWMQHVGISNSDQEGMFFLTCFYGDLQRSDYSVEPATALNSALDSQSDTKFKQGMIAGGKDALTFKQHEIKPTALTKHISTLITACKNCGQKLRVPRGKTIDITCPNCSATARITT